MFPVVVAASTGTLGELPIWCPPRRWALNGASWPSRGRLLRETHSVPNEPLHIRQKRKSKNVTRSTWTTPHASRRWFLKTGWICALLALCRGNWITHLTNCALPTLLCCVCGKRATMAHVQQPMSLQYAISLDHFSFFTKLIIRSDAT